MITGPVLAVAIGIAAICYAGTPLVHGVKKLDHAIASKLHHHKAADPQKAEQK